jgi:flagellar biosynthesis/type III secretory pathway protein FliH
LSPEASVAAVRFPSFSVPLEGPDPVEPSPVPGLDLRAVRDTAFAEGVAQGCAEGAAAARAEWTPRLVALASAMEAASAALGQRRDELATEIGAHLAEIVVALARKVLDRELMTGEAAVRATAQQLARRLTAGGVVGVRVDPAVADVLTAWRGTGGVIGDVAVRADVTLGPGDFVIETDAGFLDGRVATQLEEAARLLAEPTS